MAILRYEGEEPKSAAEQIGNLLTAIPQEIQKRQQRQKEDVMEQVKLYSTLREAGYSPEDATTKVNRTYRSTGFIESFFTGRRDNVFQQPGPEDKIELKRRKAEVDIKKTEGEIGLLGAKKKYYEEGGPKRSIIDKMTPNQLQQRLKFLQKSLEITDPGSEEEQQMKLEFDYVNQRIQQIAGYEVPPTEKAPVESGKMRVVRLSDGKKGTINAADFNPKKYKKA